jgi:hypothetical protein
MDPQRLAPSYLEKTANRRILYVEVKATAQQDYGLFGH